MKKRQLNAIEKIKEKKEKMVANYFAINEDDYSIFGCSYYVIKIQGGGISDNLLQDSPLIEKAKKCFKDYEDSTSSCSVWKLKFPVLDEIIKLAKSEDTVIFSLDNIPEYGINLNYLLDVLHFFKDYSAEFCNLKIFLWDDDFKTQAIIFPFRFINKIK